MKMSEIHQILVDEGLDPYEGVSFSEIQRLQRERELTEIQAGLVALSCPEWWQLKQDLGVTDND